VGSSDTALDGDQITDPMGRGDLGVEPPSQNMQLPVLCCHLVNRNEERFHFLSNYFGPCLYMENGTTLRQASLLLSNPLQTICDGWQKLNYNYR